MESTNNEFDTLLSTESELQNNSTESELQNNSIENDKKEIVNNSNNQIKNYTVVVNLSKQAIQIEFEILATGEVKKILATNGELRLMQGRFYFIPVEPFGINSDDFNNIKILSDMARIIDVKYVKDGYACVSVLRHNVSLKHGTRLCVIW